MQSIYYGTLGLDLPFRYVNVHLKITLVSYHINVHFMLISNRGCIKSIQGKNIFFNFRDKEVVEELIMTSLTS